MICPTQINQNASPIMEQGSGSRNVSLYPSLAKKENKCGGMENNSQLTEILSSFVDETDKIFNMLDLKKSHLTSGLASPLASKYVERYDVHRASAPSATRVTRCVSDIFSSDSDSVTNNNTYQSQGCPPNTCQGQKCPSESDSDSCLDSDLESETNTNICQSQGCPPNTCQGQVQTHPDQWLYSSCGQPIFVPEGNQPPSGQCQYSRVQPPGEPRNVIATAISHGANANSTSITTSDPSALPSPTRSRIPQNNSLQVSYPLSKSNIQSFAQHQFPDAHSQMFKYYQDVHETLQDMHDCIGNILVKLN